MILNMRNKRKTMLPECSRWKNTLFFIIEDDFKGIYIFSHSIPSKFKFSKMMMHMELTRKGKKLRNVHVDLGINEPTEVH